MSANFFVNQRSQPTEEELARALGAARRAWSHLLVALARETGADVYEWKSYSPKAGWSLRVLRKKRTVLWLSPRAGCFEVTFILGERAMQAAQAAKLPPTVAQALDEATHYPEGAAVRLTVKSVRELRPIQRLAELKLVS